MRFTFLLLLFYFFSAPVAAAVEFIVSPIGSLLLLVDTYWPIHDTIKINVAAKGIDKKRLK